MKSEHNGSVDFPIDLVYLWVDGSDPAWQAKRNAAIGKPDEKVSMNCEGRYASHDELKYSIRSAERFAPWIRNIFIVTDNQVPKWLDTSHPRIRVVDHKEILPADVLPCFNSVVIEHHICNIPDLAEHFMYANDDMLFGRPVTPEMFFTPQGAPIVRLNRRFMRKLYLQFEEKVLKKKLSNYNKKVRNAAELVERHTGVYYGGKMHHNIDSYLKSHCRHVEDLFFKEFEPTFVHRMRDDSDYQRSIFQYMLLAEKKGKVRYVSQRESMRIHIENEKHYAKFERYAPMLFCMNDSEYASEDDRLRAAAFLEKLFPEKSQFEL